jgi:hypothetical protein
VEALITIEEKEYSVRQLSVTILVETADSYLQHLTLALAIKVASLPITKKSYKSWRRISELISE